MTLNDRRPTMTNHNGRLDARPTDQDRATVRAALEEAGGEQQRRDAAFAYLRAGLRQLSDRDDDAHQQLDARSIARCRAMVDSFDHDFPEDPR
jgi:hypothetical protein